MKNLEPSQKLLHIVTAQDSETEELEALLNDDWQALINHMAQWDYGDEMIPDICTLSVLLSWYGMIVYGEHYVVIRQHGGLLFSCYRILEGE